MTPILSVSEKAAGAMSGSGMRSVGRTIPGPSASIDLASSRVVTAGHAASAAVQVKLIL